MNQKPYLEYTPESESELLKGPATGLVFFQAST